MPDVSELEDVTDALLEASKALVGIALRTLPGQVTLSQFRALALLEGAGGMRSSDLADALDVSPSTATRMCDRLVRAGLIDRVTPEDDRRQVRLTLTPTGTKLVRDGLAGRRRALGHLVRQIPDEDRTAFVRGLRVFEGAGRTNREPAWAHGWRDEPREATS